MSEHTQASKRFPVCLVWRAAVITVGLWQVEGCQSSGGWSTTSDHSYESSALVHNEKREQASQGRPTPIAQTAPAETQPIAVAPPAMPGTSVEPVLGNWPSEQKQVVQSLLRQYGPPTASSSDMIVWQKAGPFREVVVKKEAMEHRFPIPHKDFLTLTINQKVPVDKVSDLLAFDGSLVVDKTRGTLSSSSNSMGMSLLSLNLAKEIIDGKRTPQDARTFAAQQAQAMAKGGRPDYMRRLQFDVAQQDTADPGEPVTGTATDQP